MTPLTANFMQLVPGSTRCIRCDWKVPQGLDQVAEHDCLAAHLERYHPDWQTDGISTPSVPVAAQEGDQHLAFVAAQDKYNSAAVHGAEEGGAALPVEGAAKEPFCKHCRGLIEKVESGVWIHVRSGMMVCAAPNTQAEPASKPEPSTPEPQNEELCVCGHERDEHSLCKSPFSDFTGCLHVTDGNVYCKCFVYRPAAEASTIPVAPKDEPEFDEVATAANAWWDKNAYTLDGMGRVECALTGFQAGSRWRKPSVPSVAASPQEGTRFGELYERSKRDDAIIVGSEVREVIGAYRRAMDGVEYWKKRGLFICGQNSTGIKQGCGKEISSDEMYRCADCKLPFCKQCVTSHFTDEHKNLREAMEAHSLALAAAKDEIARMRGHLHWALMVIDNSSEGKPDNPLYLERRNQVDAALRVQEKESDANNSKNG